MCIRDRVNTQTHTRTASDLLYYYLSQEGTGDDTKEKGEGTAENTPSVAETNISLKAMIHIGSRDKWHA